MKRRNVSSRGAMLRGLSGVAGALVLAAVAVAPFTSCTRTNPPGGGNGGPPGGTGKFRGALFVRGYVATPVSTTGDRERLKSRDIYLPEVTVTLRNLATGEESKPVATDLSGRFTLPAGPGRFQVCWTAQGFTRGCSKAVAVSTAPVHVGVVRIGAERKPDRTTLVYGKVTLKDGSVPRTLEPFADVNSFAHVSVVDERGNVLRRVAVNNFGEYVLPQVPVKQKITLVAQVEGAKVEQPIFPEAELHRAASHPIDLTFANSPPRLQTLTGTDGPGRRVRVAKVGDTISCKAAAEDPDGDPVKFRWVVAGGSGALGPAPAVAGGDPTVQWTLPAEAGMYTLYALASDGKGGYARSQLVIRSDAKGVLFSGKVDAVDAPAVAGAQVEVNGQSTTTAADGSFRFHVKDADRFVLNVRSPRHMLYSRIFDAGVTGARITLARAMVTSVDPRNDIDVVQRRDKRDCPGPLSAKLDWRGFRATARPQWQDGKGNVIEAGKLDVPLPSAPKERNRECGPGIRVRIPANSLVDADGNPPAGNVDVALGTVDLSSGWQMPGDYTARAGDGSTKVMQSYGAGTVEISAGGRKFNLKPGAAAEVVIPVDESQLPPLATAAPPPQVPLLSYDEKNGVWVEEAAANLQGNVYVGKVTHFSAINMDLLKTNQSCVRLLSPQPGMPPSYNLEITVPMPGGAAPQVRTEFIDNAPPSEHVLYNLPGNTNIVLVPMHIGTSVPIGTFVVNTGGPQNPTNPNRPAGPPYHACATVVTLAPQQVPPSQPPGGEFLHGLYSFYGTNLNEPGLNPAIKAALEQASLDYYTQVDPRGRRRTLADFKTVNGFPAGEIHAVYGNSADLGFGRDMHCKRNGSDVAAYVGNYGSILTADTADVLDAIAAQATPDVPAGATVAMEYSQIEDPLPPGGAPSDPLVFSDPDRVVKFFVYVRDPVPGNPNNTKLAGAADLDLLGPRPVPQLCMVCHGGHYPGTPPGSLGPAVPTFASRNDVKLGSEFIPFDLHGFTFGAAPFDKPSQQAAFKQMNETIVRDSPPDGAVTEVITGMYAGGPVQDEGLVVPGWNGDPRHRVMYRDVVARSCRTCHLTHPVPALKFDQALDLIDRLGQAEQRVCVQHVMPHAKVTHDLFWTSSGPHMPAQFQVFGDAFKTAANGWDGTLCGDFTAGGITPPAFYTSTIQPIFNNNSCTGCHIGASPPQGLNLTAGQSYPNLFNVNSSEVPALKRVKPGDAANSYLIHKVSGTQAVGNPMPPPSGGVSATDITALTNWINSGAPGP